MGLEIVPLTREHVIDLFPRRRADALLFNLTDTMTIVGEAMRRGVAYTAIDGDRAICLGGVYVSHERIGNGWLLGTDEIKDYAKDFTRILKESIPVIMEEMRLDRLQVDVVCDKPQWIKWTEYLGFTQEGVLRKFRNGKDAVVMSIIKEDL